MRRRPGFVETIGLLLLDTVVTGEVEALGIVRFQVRVGRRGAECGDVVWEVALEDHQRKARVRVFRKSRRQQHVRAEIDVAAPIGREQGAADADMAHERRVRRRSDRGDDLVERQLERRGAAADVDPQGAGIEVAGFQVPLLPFAHLWRQLDGRAVGAMEGLVAVQHRLDGVVAWGQGGEAPHGPAIGVVADHHTTAGAKAVDVASEYERRAQGRFEFDLQARLGGGLGRDDQHHPAVDRGRGRGLGGEGDGHARGVGDARARDRPGQ